MLCQEQTRLQYCQGSRGEQERDTFCQAANIRCHVNGNHPRHASVLKAIQMHQFKRMLRYALRASWYRSTNSFLCLSLMLDRLSSRSAKQTNHYNEYLLDSCTNGGKR
jgi:hypothetical protein